MCSSITTTNHFGQILDQRLKQPSCALGSPQRPQFGSPTSPFISSPAGPVSGLASFTLPLLIIDSFSHRPLLIHATLPNGIATCLDSRLLVSAVLITDLVECSGTREGAARDAGQHPCDSQKSGQARRSSILATQHDQSKCC